MDNKLLYIESQILCIALIAALLKLNAHSRQVEHKYITAICLLTIFASFADILRVWACGNIVLAYIFNVIYLSCFGFIGFLWFNYCLNQFGIKSKRLKHFALLPAIVTTGLIAALSKQSLTI